MAIAKHGLLKGLSGKVGDLICSQQIDGSTTVKKETDKPKKPATIKQLEVQQQARMIAGICRPMMDYINVGLAQAAARKKVNAYNFLVRELKSNSFVGVYPDIRLDFSTIKLTKGGLFPPQEATVVVTERGLSFSWSPELKLRGVHYSDQLMLVAIFPELKDARYLIGGTQRVAGSQELPLLGIRKGNVAECFISFITDHRKDISDSVYLGQLIW